MHIVALAWIYVVFLMAVTEHSAIAGVATFLLYGLLPLSIILYLSGTRQRKRRRAEQEKLQQSSAAGHQTPSPEEACTEERE